MPKGEEVRSVPPQNVSHIALGLEVQEIFSPSGRGRSVSLDIPLIRFAGPQTSGGTQFPTFHNGRVARYSTSCRRKVLALSYCVRIGGSLELSPHGYSIGRAGNPPSRGRDLSCARPGFAVSSL